MFISYWSISMYDNTITYFKWRSKMPELIQQNEIIENRKFVEKWKRITVLNDWSNLIFIKYCSVIHADKTIQQAELI